MRGLAFHKRKKKRKFRSLRIRALEGAPQKRAIIYKFAIVTPRKPNSARRTIAKARILCTAKRIFCKIPGIGDHFLRKFACVMVEGHGLKDVPGVKYTLIRGLEDFEIIERFGRCNRRSKFGTKAPDELILRRKLKKQYETAFK